MGHDFLSSSVCARLQYYRVLYVGLDCAPVSAFKGPPSLIHVLQLPCRLPRDQVFAKLVFSGPEGEPSRAFLRCQSRSQSAVRRLGVSRSVSSVVEELSGRPDGRVRSGRRRMRVGGVLQGQAYHYSMKTGTLLSAIHVLPVHLCMILFTICQYLPAVKIWLFISL